MQWSIAHVVLSVDFDAHRDQPLGKGSLVVLDGKMKKMKETRLAQVQKVGINPTR